MITTDIATTATSIMPRPYQREAVDAILVAHGQGMRRPLVALPTGTGKTIVFALLAQQRGGRTLVLGHRDELIQQAVDKLRLVMPNLDTANIALGLVRSFTDALLIGPFLTGLKKPAHIVIPSVTSRGIFNMSALTASDIERYCADHYCAV